MKKLFSILLALALIVSLSSVAMATKMTVEDGAEGSVYAAYKILNATDGGGDNVAYTFNEKYTQVLQTVTGKTELAEVLSYISDLASDEEGKIEFAKAVYEAIVAADIACDYTSEDSVFENIEHGYYLISETVRGDESDTYSFKILTTVRNEDSEASTKEEKPTMTKLVHEMNDSTGAEEWSNTADYDIGDSIEFVIRGTVAGDYDYYDSYYYSFTDKMEKGLTYNEDAKVYVINGEAEFEVTDYFTFTAIADEEAELAGFMVEGNLKEIDAAREDFEIDADTEIEVRYSATLNENANRGTEGNKNYAYLEYENNYLRDSDGDYTTPDRPGEGIESTEDGPSKSQAVINVVFTIDAVVNKVDNKGNALAGAGFTLYKWVKNDVDGEWVKRSNEITGVTTFRFNGLDSGIYKLVETTVPAGYNQCEDIWFEVACIYNDEVEPREMIRLAVYNADGEDISNGDNAMFNATMEAGVITTDVENVAGIVLPETGGIGTTIFYIVGAVLALGAVVFLVAMKRMKNEE